MCLAHRGGNMSIQRSFMKTLNFLSALKNKGYNAVLNKIFSYRIDKNRHYYVVTIDSAPDRELISLADSFGLMWVARTYVNTSNDIEYSVKFDAMPKDMKSFDFVEYKVFYNDNVNEPDCWTNLRIQNPPFFLLILRLKEKKK